MKRKGNRQGNQQHMLVFTPESLHLAQEALKVFERTFQHTTGMTYDPLIQEIKRGEQTPQRASSAASDTFTWETMEHVKQKLALMSSSVGAMCLTTFDRNEKLVLAASLHMYILVEIIPQPYTAQTQRARQICQEMAQDALQGLGVQLHVPTQD
jgi:hypothetical protein